VLFFFFQAEDGIRDLIVTGVQTCALPIFRDDEGGRFANRPPSSSRTMRAGGSLSRSNLAVLRQVPFAGFVELAQPPGSAHFTPRSEERRVGKECRSWLAPL